MSSTDYDEPADLPTTARGVSQPRALAYENFSFNFKIDLGSRVAARYGAPAFAQRRSRLNRRTEAFWSGLTTRYGELWKAARDGRVTDDGRELRQNLLTADGADPIGAREHRRRLFSAKIDREVDHRDTFNRAWMRHLDRCGLEDLALEVDGFNRWFPIEADLPIDIETEQYVWMGMPWEPPVAPTRDDVLTRFPLR